MDLEYINGVLNIPGNKRDQMEQDYPNVEKRIQATVRFWLLTDPLASWRRIIQQLDRWDKHDSADRIRHYSEELTGMCVCVCVCVSFLLLLCEHNNRIVCLSIVLPMISKSMYD